MRDRLRKSIESVVKNGNCTGCGGCVLVSQRVTMSLNDEGFMRPMISPIGEQSVASALQEATVFKEMCPGRGVVAAEDAGPSFHPAFGAFHSAWEASAIDDDLRYAGSSGGVLTALTTWLIESGQTKSAIGSASNPAEPNRTVPVRIQSREEALASAGSRYAPVSVLTAWTGEPDVTLIGKPCEISAAAQYRAATKSSSWDAPLTLSFFCAGTPSQHATDSLSESLGIEIPDVQALRYRGNGWPGSFEVESKDGSLGSLSYDMSWGKHLGRQLQWRCKLCPDGTGGHADIAVGDYWNADSSGYPVFEDAAGNSVAIARTARGHAILEKAKQEGILRLLPLDLAKVASVQPLQVERKATMIGRLLGRVLALKRIPHYRGFHLFALAQSAWRKNIKALIGTYIRTTNLRK